MADITIELLETKQTRQRINGYEVSMVAQRSGYQIVAGENNVTEIEVFYPAQYKNISRLVYMVNALKRGKAIRFEQGEERVVFVLPASMTFAGNTWLTFSASDGSTETNWVSVPILITATHRDYKGEAQASPDILEDAVQSIDKIKRLFPVDSTNADNVGVANVFVADSGKLTFENLKGNKGDTPYIQDGNWWISGIDTGVKAAAIAVDSIDKTDTLDETGNSNPNGHIDIYTITYSDGHTQEFRVTNGRDGGLTIEAQNAINANTILSQEAKQVADSVRIDADSGKFNGKDGSNGVIIEQNIFLGFELGEPTRIGNTTRYPVKVLGGGIAEFSSTSQNMGNFTRTIVTVQGV